MPVPHHSAFTGRMPLLPPNQQHQSTEGIGIIEWKMYGFWNGADKPVGRYHGRKYVVRILRSLNKDDALLCVTVEKINREARQTVREWLISLMGLVLFYPGFDLWNFWCWGRIQRWKIKEPNDDPGCTFGGNLQPGWRVFQSGLNPGEPRCQIKPWF